MHARVVGLAILGIALNQALFLAGLKRSSPFTVSLLGVTIPVFTAALAVVFRKERASWRTGVGLALSISGVLWLSGVGAVATSGAAGASIDAGALIVTLNSLSFAAYVVFSREVVIVIGPRRLMVLAFTYATLLFAPVGLPALIATIPTLTTRGVLLLVYIVAVPTILAYWLNAWALARSTASMVTIYIYIQPLIAGLLARLQLGLTISSRAGLAAALIVSGVLVTTLKTTRRPQPEGGGRLDK